MTFLSGIVEHAPVVMSIERLTAYLAATLVTGMWTGMWFHAFLVNSSRNNRGDGE